METTIVIIAITIPTCIICLLNIGKWRLRYKLRKLPYVETIYTLDISQHMRNKDRLRKTPKKNITDKLSSFGHESTNFLCGDVVRHLVPIGIYGYSRMRRHMGEAPVIGFVENINKTTLKVRGRSRTLNNKYLPKDAPYDSLYTIKPKQKILLASSKMRSMLTFGMKAVVTSIEHV